MAFADGPLIVQSDKTVLLEIDHAQAGAARAALAPFAELERAPEHIHTYRITPLALWNARAAGHDAEGVVDVLEKFSRFPVPQALLIDVAETMSRYGRVRLHKHPAHGLILESAEPAILAELIRHKKIHPMLGAQIDAETIVVHPSERGRLKQELLKVGWPAEDLAGYVDGEAHPIALSQEHEHWELRDYQKMAADSFWEGGSGVVVAPLWGRKDHGGSGFYGPGASHHPYFGHQHRSRTTMARRAITAHNANARGDRRIFRGEKGDSTGDHRNVSSGHS